MLKESYGNPSQLHSVFCIVANSNVSTESLCLSTYLLLFYATVSGIHLVSC